MADALGWLSRLLGGGDPEAQGAAQASSAIQPSVYDMLQDRLRGLQNTYADTRRLGSTVGNYLAQAPGAAIDYAGNEVARPFLQQQEALMNRDWSKEPLIGTGEGGELTGRIPALASMVTPYLYGGAPSSALSSGLRIPNPIRAYHGSPHDFSRFDMSKIGTGEGGATFGKGINLAEDARVAEGYRDSLSREGGGRGYVYETNINADPSRLLEWSKPLSQQSEIVQRGLADLRGQLRPITDVKQYVQSFLSTDYAKSFPRASDVARARHVLESGDLEDMVEWAGKQTGPGSSAFNLVGPFATPADRLTGGNILRRLDEKTLESAGIAGTKYAPPERTAAPGTSNYVVFDDKLIDILRKYGIAGPVVGGSVLAAGSEPPT